MKNIRCYLMLLFVWMGQHAIGQFSVGVNTGVNIAHLKSNFAAEIYEGHLVQLMVGLSPQYQLNNKLNFVLNMQYSPKGYSYADMSSDLKQRLSYWDFIPELEYGLTPQLKIAIGGYWAVLQDEEINNNGEGWRSVKHLGNTNESDYGWSLKLQYDYKSLQCFVRYAHGLADLSDLFLTGTDGMFVQEIDFYNRSFQVGLGYKIESFRINHVD